jgi:rod shape determining protein RodA
MQINRRLAAQFDWPIFILAIGLALTGIMTIYSATCGAADNCTGFLAKKQLYWLIIGIGVMIATCSFDYQRFDRWTYPLYAVVLLMLVLVPFMGTSSGGSQRWLNLRFFSFQPSELAKLMIVILMAKMLRYGESDTGYSFPDLWAPLLLAAPVFALILLQPDLGTAVLISLVSITILAMGGLRIRSLVRLVLVAVASLPILWQVLKPYQRQRIWTFINPEFDPLGAGYHVFQSKIAIGSGLFWGKGYLQGSQNRLEFLPEQHTDFIFSVFAEEWGFFGCLLLLAGYAMLILLALRVVQRAPDRFGSILAAGMTAIIFWQVTINIGMVTGILPVVGIPLPLVSYGGSSLVTTMIALGVVISVSMRSGGGGKG